MHASRDQERWVQGGTGFAIPTNPRQTTLVGADDWRDETGLATWLLSQTGVIFRSLPLRRACNSASNGCCGVIRFLAKRCCHCVYCYRVTSADVRKG